MNRDIELESWQQLWKADDSIPRDLRSTVDAGTRHLRRGLIGEVGVTVVMGGGSALWALVSQRVDALVLAVGVWVLIGVAWATSIALRRDLWRPVAETHAAFLDLTILRTRRQVQGVVAQTVLYVVIFAFDLAWIYFSRLQTQPLDPWGFLTSRRMFVAWIVTGVLAVTAAWYWRRQRLLLQNLLRLRRQLDDPHADP